MDSSAPAQHRIHLVHPRPVGADRARDHNGAALRPSLLLYLDTSVLVRTLAHESESGAIHAWLGEQMPDRLAISEWVVSEFTSGLSSSAPMQEIDMAQRSASLRALSGPVLQTCTLLPISGRHFQTAARYVRQAAPGLRASGALHLAIASDHGAVLCTLDRRLADAGASLGISTLLL